MPRVWAVTRIDHIGSPRELGVRIARSERSSDRDEGRYGSQQERTDLQVAPHTRKAKLEVRRID